MRLRPEKIDQLAELIHAALASNPEVELAESPDKIKGLIRQIIHEDLAAEDEIEEEARKLLEPHKDEIQRKNMAFDKMLMKTKQKIARERKMVL